MKAKRTYRRTFSAGALMVALLLAAACNVWAKPPASNLRFEISFPSSLHAEPITGRVFVILSDRERPEPRYLAGFWGDTAPLFGVDVDQLKPGASAIIDASTLGYPPQSLADIPAGDYYVQALLNVYTQCHRSDGHAVWVHMDQWEGQQFNRSPGNLYSEVVKVHLDPAAGYDVKLSLSKVIPPSSLPPDMPWVKHIKIKSERLSKFWGQPIYLGAVVLLPKDYDSHPSVYYPTIYEQGHFDLGAPFRFSSLEQKAPERFQKYLSNYNLETGYQFYQAWNSDSFPRFIAVTIQHPTPYFDDSYAVNSANNGPYGDALLTELIPYLEAHFRMIPRPYARVLTGGSTGGWESLALQVFHPDFFGGTWTLYPDPISFEHYQLVNIYKDDNAFLEPGHHWMKAYRPMQRTEEGQVEVTIQQMSQLEAVLGSHGRSGQQLEAWEAVYGPVGDDGYPKPLWDKQSGKIDLTVAESMREHGYDLTAYLRQNWPKIGPELVGKIHIQVGDMDNYYLNLACYDLENFLKTTSNPHDDGTFVYGRPEKGHGWEAVTPENMVREMADHITRNAPVGEDTNAWKYK